MTPTALAVREQVVLDEGGLQNLIDILAGKGRKVIGPVVRDRSIEYEEIESINDLPRGWGDEQEAGTYRIRRRSDERFFGFASTSQSWRRILFPPSETLFKVRRADGDLKFNEGEPQPSYAFLGVHACDLAAIKIQDQVFAEGENADPRYNERRNNTFIVAVNCSTPSATCFCASQGTGPDVRQGHDIALTEVIDGGRHYFVAEAGSDQGRETLSSIQTARQAEAAEVGAAKEVIEHASASMGRSLDNDGIKELLYANYDHPRWDNVADRCLACTNCSLVCPTCFCNAMGDVTSIDGQEAERRRRWDSCFTLGHSYIHGGSVRLSHKSRYRQWMTHKIATWIDQFGVSGCVGCGRCIAWCPVGIDITEEARAIRLSPGNEGVHGEYGTAVKDGE